MFFSFSNVLRDYIGKDIGVVDAPSKLLLLFIVSGVGISVGVGVGVSVSVSVGIGIGVNTKKIFGC